MKHRRSHFTLYILHFTLLFAAAFSGVAKTLSWRLHQEPAAVTFAAYHGETVEFAPVASNVVFEAIYYQTNGMERTWWRTDGLVFHPTNDVGASAYRFFVAGHDATGRDWRANGLLRLLDSPGFEPAAVELPVKTLDFAAVEVANAPWPAAIAEATNATLAAAADYTDTSAASLASRVSVASQAATNYTDTVAAGIVDEFTNKVDRIGGSARELKIYDGLTIAPAQMRNGTSAIFDEGAVRLTTVGPSGVNYREVLWPSTAGTLAVDENIPSAVSNVVTKAFVEGLGIASEETDPTVPAWAKAASKPAYTANEIGALPSSTTHLSGDVPTSRKINGKALSADVTLTAANVGAAPASDSARIDAIEMWAIGEDVAITVRNATQTNATFEVSYTNELMYSSAVQESNTLDRAAAAARVEIDALAADIDERKADKSWGDYTSGGAPSPDDTLLVEKPRLSLTGGANYAYIEATSGGYYALAVTLGGTWTLESLAAEQNPDNPTSFSVKDGEGNTAWTVTSTSSREVACVAGFDMLAPTVEVAGGNDVVTMRFPVDAADHPAMEYRPYLGGDVPTSFAEATAANWPQYISSVSWTQSTHLWTATITMHGQPGQGFFRAKYTQSGTTYTSFVKPLGFSQVVIGGVTYNITVETVNGKKLMVLSNAN